MVFLSPYSLLVLHQPNTTRHDSTNQPSNTLPRESHRSTSFDPLRSSFLSRRLRRRRIQSLLINPRTGSVIFISLLLAS